MNGMSKSMFCPIGEAFNSVWWAERMVHVASDKKTPMSLAFTDLAMLSSAVGSMFVGTA